MTSDHSPVFATFTLEIANQYVSRIGAGACPMLCVCDFVA
jgi:hypothetical protein